MGDLVFADFGGNEMLLSKKELASRLGYSVRHIEKLAALGMPSEIWGRRRVFKETRCRNWLTQERGDSHAGQTLTQVRRQAQG